MKAEENVSFYMLLKNGKVVYVGIAICVSDRVTAHWNKGWDFDDVIENSEGPYSRSVALWFEKRLIAKYRPKYNVVHNNGSSIRRRFIQLYARQHNTTQPRTVE